jgi:hypothetical protein
MERKAAEIAKDAVGAAELQGVTKLLYNAVQVNFRRSAGLMDQGVQQLVQSMEPPHGITSWHF